MKNQAATKKKRVSKPNVDPQKDLEFDGKAEIETNETSSPNSVAPVTLNAQLPPEILPADVANESKVIPPAENLSPQPDPYFDLIPRHELIDYKSATDLMIQDLQDRLSHEEDAAAGLSSTKKKLEGDISNLKKDLENLELSLQKVRMIPRHARVYLTPTIFLCHRLSRTKPPKTTRSET